MYKHLILIVFISLYAPRSSAQDARLAVASNFVNTAQVLVLKFSEQTTYKISLSAASTGKFYAQIRQAAPFDAFLSADRQTPSALPTKALLSKRPCLTMPEAV